MTKMLNQYFIMPLCILLCCRVGIAADKYYAEYQVKAALIFKFIHYTTWNKGFVAGNKQVSLCVEGNRRVYDSFTFLNSEQVHGAAVKVIHIDILNDAKKCDVLFIAHSSRHEPRKTLMHIQGLPILTIGETANFNILGGMIRFYLRDHRTRFAISPENTRSSGLRISSRLLSVADIVFNTISDAIQEHKVGSHGETLGEDLQNAIVMPAQAGIHA